MIGRCPVPISLTADARLGVFFIEPDVLKTMLPFNNTTPIYLINLLWKLGLAFFKENKVSKHLIFRKFRGW